MAEILGAASGVLSVAEVGFSLASTLYKYASSVKGAENELKAIAKDVELTSKVLKQTHEQLQKDRDQKLCTVEAIDVTSDVLEGCRDAFQEVDVELKRSIKTGVGGKSTLSITSRLRFPLKSNKMELLRANLEKLKTTLLLMLSVLAYGRKISSTSTMNVEVKAEISLEKLQIQNLVLARDEATKRYEEMSAAFARLESRLSPPSHQQSTLFPAGSVHNVFAHVPSAPSPSAAFTSNAYYRPPSPPSPPSPPLRLRSAPRDQTKPAVDPPPVPSMHDSFENAKELSTPVTDARSGNSSKPSNQVSKRLGHCASAVMQLATTIEVAIQRWEHFQVLNHGHITNSLNETVKAIAYLDPDVTARQDPVDRRKPDEGAEAAAEAAAEEAEEGAEEGAAEEVAGDADGKAREAGIRISSRAKHDVYQMTTLDDQAASRLADERMRRNAPASARFRQRRKEKEREWEREIAALKKEVEALKQAGGIQDQLPSIEALEGKELSETGGVGYDSGDLLTGIQDEDFKRQIAAGEIDPSILKISEEGQVVHEDDNVPKAKEERERQFREILEEIEKNTMKIEMAIGEAERISKSTGAVILERVESEGEIEGEGVQEVDVVEAEGVEEDVHEADVQEGDGLGDEVDVIDVLERPGSQAAEEAGPEGEYDDQEEFDVVDDLVRRWTAVAI